MMGLWGMSVGKITKTNLYKVQTFWVQIRVVVCVQYLVQVVSSTR
jgi:hypothetical protein